MHGSPMIDLSCVPAKHACMHAVSHPDWQIGANLTNWSISTHHGRDIEVTLAMLCCNLFPCILFFRLGLCFFFSIYGSDLWILKRMASSDREIRCEFPSLAGKKRPTVPARLNLRQRSISEVSWWIDHRDFVKFRVFSFAPGVSWIHLKKKSVKMCLFPEKKPIKWPWFGHRYTSQAFVYFTYRKYILWNKLLVALAQQWSMHHSSYTGLLSTEPEHPKNISVYTQLYICKYLYTYKFLFLFILFFFSRKCQGV